jgi:PST family polysaccharide transporter
LLQLGGDVLRMSSWVFAYQMIARGMTGAFVLWEIIVALLRIGFTALLIRWWGLHGAVAAYLCCYVVYGAGVAWIFRHQFRKAP